MEARLAAIAAEGGDQKEKTQKYQTVLTESLSNGGDVEGLKQMVVHMLSDVVPLVTSRQILSTLCSEAKSLPAAQHKDFAEFALEKITPRVVSFEEQVSVLREGLAKLLKDDGKASEAASMLAGIDLDSGIRNLSDEYKLRMCVDIAMLYLEDDDATNAKAKKTRFVSFRGAAHSLVYFRAGYAPADYPSDKQWYARLLLEQSGAVKSPSAAMQLAGTKKIQQALAAPGALERFAARMTQKNGANVAAMRAVFAGLYALDDAGAAEAVSLALADPGGFVLKPQREGGGNNLYGEEMVRVLRTHDPSAARGSDGDLSAFILMQRIFPPVNRTLCLRGGEMVELETLSELGVYGGYVRVGDTVTRNAHGGYLLRTKAATSDEGGVAAGFAVLDSVSLE